MRKIVITSFLFLIGVLTAFAQKEIKGRVVSGKQRKPVIAATVTMHPLNSQTILTYAVAADDGSFTLTHAQMPDSVRLSVRAMNIEPQIRVVKSNVGFVEFVVKEKNTELQEVIVRAPKIRQKGDTINYNVARFTDATDRSIADVLRKLPGVQVLSSGQVLYQNKPISKFYIEGMDMLKGKYGIATQNVDASNVATVQVLENHQPIRALKDMELPEAAAINLKLKRSAKGAFFATAQLGAGFPLWLLSNELVGMRFTRNQQNMLVYKGDNTGRDVAQELVTFYDDTKNMGYRFLSLPMPTPPSINAQHYLFNNAHTASLNDLRVLKKELTLTGNLNYLDDKQKSHSYAKNEILLTGDDNIHIEEKTDAHLRKRELEAVLTLEGNTDNHFLNNKLRLQSKWNDRHSELLPGNDDPVTQFLKLPEFQISNDFEYLLKKGNKRYRMGAFVGYISQHHALQVKPSLFAPILKAPDSDNKQLRQNVDFRHLTTKAYLSGGIEAGEKLSVWYTTTFYTNHYGLASDLYSGVQLRPITADSLQNNFARNEYGITANPRFVYNVSSNFKPTLSLPITYSRVNRNDKTRTNERNNGYWLFAPSLYIQQELSSRINMYSNFSFSNSIGGINEDYLGYIMSTYRNMKRSDGLESKHRNFHGYVNLSYRNPFTALFSTLTLSYTNRWSNMLRDIRYNGMLSSATGIYHPNASQMFSTNASVSQSVEAIRSEVKFSAGYNQSNSIGLHQGKISDIRYRSFYGSTYIVTDIGRYMIAKYSATYRQGRNQIDKEKMPVMHSFTQKISASIIPAKKLVLNISFNHYYNNLLESSARSSWFGNASVKYKMKSADILLDWSNIFNTRQFINSSYSDVSSYYSEYRLRPSEVLLRVRFKIF